MSDARITEQELFDELEARGEPIQMIGLTDGRRAFTNGSISLANIVEVVNCILDNQTPEQ